MEISHLSKIRILPIFTSAWRCRRGFGDGIGVASFSIDDEIPFTPLPFDEAVAMLEWCLNWCIESRAHQYLIIHAAIVEKHGSACVLPAPPASGKSTLTAGLASRGWRLLSDELTLIDPMSGFAVPIARPIGLKNESIA
jgi:HprK-related kinase A